MTQYNLPLPEALAELEKFAAKNSAQTAEGIITEGLVGVTPEQAYDIGYATAVYDLTVLTGPDPLEVEVRVGTIIDPKEDNA